MGSARPNSWGEPATRVGSEYLRPRVILAARVFLERITGPWRTPAEAAGRSCIISVLQRAGWISTALQRIYESCIYSIYAERDIYSIECIQTHIFISIHLFIYFKELANMIMEQSKLSATPNLQGGLAAWGPRKR